MDPWWCEDLDCVVSHEGIAFDPRDLTQWLYNEMKTNVNDPIVVWLRNRENEIRHKIECEEYPLGVIDVIIDESQRFWKFRNQVKDGARWDFKDEIGFKIGPGITLCPAGNCYNDIEYSVPGNVFYGYIGRAAGFSGFELQAGAAWAEWRDPAHNPRNTNGYVGPYQGEKYIDLSVPIGYWNLGDEARDHQAVTFGIFLWDKYQGNFTLGQFKRELGQFIDKFDRHVPSSDPVREEIAGQWPYPVGFFNNRGQEYVP